MLPSILKRPFVTRYSSARRHWIRQAAMNATQLELMKEPCIVVNEQDEILGFDSKQNCHRNPGILHRAFSVFLFNSKKELLLQQRSKDKITFPMYWANTCCSHPLYIDEEIVTKDHIGVKRAAIRKLEQELGIVQGTLTPNDFKFITRILYKADSDTEWGEHEIDHILVVQSDVVVDNVNPNEVSQIKYVKRNELKSFLNQSNEKISPWFYLIAKTLLPHWWDHLDEYTVQDQIDPTIHHLK